VRQPLDAKIFEVQIDCEWREHGGDRGQLFAGAERIRRVEADASAFAAGGLE